MALADAAMYAVILGRLGAVEMAVTSNLNINFLSKPRPEDLLAEASILAGAAPGRLRGRGVFAE